MFLGLGWPTNASAADILQIYRAAQRNDATFQAARHGFYAARQAIPQARSGLLPHLDLEGSGGFTRANTAFSGGPSVNRNIRTRTWSLRLDQPVFNLEKLYAYRTSKLTVEEASARFAQAQADLILRVTRAYFNDLVAEQEVTAAQGQVAATREQLAQAQHGFRAGTAAVTDVYEAKSRLELARSQVLAASNRLEDRRAELQKITNEWPEKLTALASTAVIPGPVPNDVAAWIRQARSDNPAVRAQQAAVSIAFEMIRRARAGYMPTLDLSASYGSNYSSNNLTNPVSYSTRFRSGELDLRLVVPIYSGGETNSKVAEAIEKREQAASTLEAVQRQSAMDARKAFAGVENGLARVEALEASLRAGQSAVKGDEKGYRLGLRINTDVLSAQAQVYSTISEEAKARYDALFQGLKLKAAAGQLTETDLVALNTLFLKAPVSR